MSVGASHRGGCRVVRIPQTIESRDLTVRVANNPERRRQMLPPALYNQGGLAAFVFGSDGQDPGPIFGCT
jgi:hypothetical protein